MVAPLLIYEGAKAIAGIAAGGSQRRAEKAQLKLNQQRLRMAQGLDSFERLDRFLSARGTQRAAFASGGLAGGLTRRLFEADTRLKYMQSQQAASAGFTSQTSNAQAAYRQRAAGSRFGGVQSAISSGIDILNTKAEDGQTYGGKLYQQAVKSAVSILPF